LLLESDALCTVFAAVDNPVQIAVNMDTNIEKDCAILEEFFQHIILDMKVIVCANSIANINVAH